MMYDVAIVTVAHNKLFPECLTSIREAMAASSLSSCFVLVDNASTSFAAHEFVRSHIPDAIVVLRDANHGMGASSNRGAREVDAKYYFFLNPDTTCPDPAILQRLFAFMEAHPKVGIVAPRIHHMDGTFQETHRRFPAWYMPLAQRTWLAKTARGARYASTFLMRDVRIKKPRMIDWAQGSALFVAADVLRALQGFDERFWMYFEDVDFCRRSWEMYRPVYYHPEIVLHHAFGKGSAVSGNVVKSFAMNRQLRAHISSWIKYLLKWSVRRRAVATR
jgi:GT2 family glycosyltransferase